MGTGFGEQLHLSVGPLGVHHIHRGGPSCRHVELSLSSCPRGHLGLGCVPGAGAALRSVPETPLHNPPPGGGCLC